MFWDKWIPAKYYVKTEICAVEVCFGENGLLYHHTHLRTKGSKLELAATGTSADSPGLPDAILKNKIPLLLILNGKGIILKKISISENSEQGMEEIIRQNLPAINLNEFYAQLYRQSDHSAFVALCRKEQLDKVLEEFRLKKYDIGNVLIGTPALMGLKPLWGNFNALKTSIHEVELTNGVIDSIAAASPSSETKDTIKIDDLNFNAAYTLGFAGGLSYLMRNPVAEDHSPNLAIIQQQHIEKNKLRFLTLVVVGIAFLLAVVNVVFYTHYFDKNNKLETELGVYQGKYEQINELLADYQKNKDLIENAGVLNRNKLSEYADRIGKTLPDEVVLSDLYFNPKKEDEENMDSLVTFQNKSLILKGNCSKSFIVNEWINVLKMQKFIKDVSLEKFVYNNQGVLPNFEIRLITE